MQEKNRRGKVILLVGKVASGKTTYARKMQEEKGVVFLSLDQLQISIFGENPSREQLDSSYSGCCEYQQCLAVKLLNNGLDVYLDWGFWQHSDRHETREFFEKSAIEVEQYYFDIPEQLRLQRNRKRNNGNDSHSFKIEEKDVAFFDGFFEAPGLNENDKVFTF